MRECWHGNGDGSRHRIARARTQNCRAVDRVLVTARMLAAADNWTVGSSGRNVAGRDCWQLVTVDHAHDAQQRGRDERDHEHERERRKPHDLSSIHALYSSTLRSLSAFPITETELNVMAALAIIGLSSNPNHG
jgi:hypothetical protein